MRSFLRLVTKSLLISGEMKAVLAIGARQLVSGSDAEGMASAHIHVQSSLYATVQEVGCSALALAVVRCHTIAHVAAAIHSGISDTSAQHRLHIVEFGCIGAPRVCLVHVDAIVVTEFSALVNQLACVVRTGCVQVVLHTWVGH